MALQAPAGAYQAPSWPEDIPAFAPATPTRTAPWKRSRRASAGDHTDAAADSAAADLGSGAADTGASRNWRAHVRELQTIMDGGLRDALSGALLLLKEQVPSSSLFIVASNEFMTHHVCCDVILRPRLSPSYCICIEATCGLH